MNIIKTMFNNEAIDSNELQKLRKMITVKYHSKTDSYYFSNKYEIELDSVYSEILDLRPDCYRSIIYENVKYKRYKSTAMFIDRKEAEKKKIMLCILLLNKYVTADNVMSNLKKLRDKARR